MQFEADLKFLGMASLTKFELTEEGASFVSDFNLTEVTKVGTTSGTLAVKATAAAAAAAAEAGG
jgi:hypothetical protein